MSNDAQLIEDLTLGLLKNAIIGIKKNITKAIASGCIDVNTYDYTDSPMVIPKCILIAVLEEEVDQYRAKGTKFEKMSKKEVANIKLFL